MECHSGGNEIDYEEFEMHCANAVIKQYTLSI